MKVALVSSHGGHLTETLQLLDAFKGQEIFFVTYSSSRDNEILSFAPAYFCKNIGTRLHLLLWAFFWSLKILLRERPQVIFSTGAEIALPFLVLGRLMGLKSIFLESWCRVDSLSLTGKFAYYIANEFWVQWPQMKKRCGPKAKYYGAVI